MLNYSQLFLFYTCYNQLQINSDEQKKKGLSTKIRKNVGEYQHSADSDSHVEVGFLEMLFDFNNFITSCLLMGSLAYLISNSMTYDYVFNIYSKNQKSPQITHQQNLYIYLYIYNKLQVCSILNILTITFIIIFAVLC